MVSTVRGTFNFTSVLVHFPFESVRAKKKVIALGALLNAIQGDMECCKEENQARTDKQDGL